MVCSLSACPPPVSLETVLSSCWALATSFCKQKQLQKLLPIDCKKQLQSTYIELFKRVFFFHHEAPDLVVPLTEASQRARHLFFLFVAGLPRRDKVVWLQKRALLRVRSPHVQPVFVEHNCLAFHYRRLAFLFKE